MSAWRLALRRGVLIRLRSPKDLRGVGADGCALPPDHCTGRHEGAGHHFDERGHAPPFPRCASHPTLLSCGPLAPDLMAPGRREAGAKGGGGGCSGYWSRLGLLLHVWELDPRLSERSGRPAHYRLRLCLSGRAARDLREAGARGAEAEVLAGGCGGHRTCLGRPVGVPEGSVPNGATSSIAHHSPCSSRVVCAAVAAGGAGRAGRGGRGGCCVRLGVQDRADGAGIVAIKKKRILHFIRLIMTILFE